MPARRIVYMNQSSIKPISRVQPSEVNTLLKATPPVPEDTFSQSRLQSARQEKAQAEGKENLADDIGSLKNVSIHFRVDDKTDNVTVFLVDRKTKKVLRAIPADELQKLQIADLLKLTA